MNNPTFYFPFQIVNNHLAEDNESYYIKPCMLSYTEIKMNKNYKNFVLEENLQHLYLETTELLSKGFIEKILNESPIDKISKLAIEYRKNWKEELWESEDSDEFGLNEFIGVQAEAYENCLEILRQNV